MLKNWIKIFLYNSRQNKLFVFLNIFGLSIGIAGLVFAMLYWNDEQSYNAWNPEKEKVFQVVNDQPRSGFLSYNVAPLGPNLKALSPQVESYCTFQSGYRQGLMEYRGKKELVYKITVAENNFFSFFPFQFIKGKGATALKEKNSIAISDETAELFFGKIDPIGQQLKLWDKIYVVQGVYKITGKSSVAPKIVIRDQMDDYMKENADNWRSHSDFLVIKLKNPADKSIVEGQIKALYFEKQAKAGARDKGVAPEAYIKNYGMDVPYLEVLKSARLHSQVKDGYPEGSGNYQFLMIMLSLSVLILILSIVNYINLATANAIKRAKEVGVRKIIGASKVQIVWQFLFETVVTTVVAILIALVIVELSLPYYNEFLGKELVIHNNQFYLQLILVFLVTIVFAGIFPAIYISNFEVLKVLKGNFGRSKKGIWLRNGMLILQFAIASFFITGSYIVYQQIDFLTRKELGFQGSQIIEARLYNPKPTSDYEMIRNELLRIKGVEEVSSGNFTFGYGSYFTSVFAYKGNDVEVENMAMEFELLDMMNIKVLEGRKLMKQYASDTVSSVLINEAAAEMMTEPHPVGKEFDFRDDGVNSGMRHLKIVGVVKNFNLQGPDRKIPPMLFYHHKTISENNFLTKFFIKIAPEHGAQTLADIETFWKKNVDQEYPFAYDFVDQNFARTYKSYVDQRNLFSLLNIVVIIIALFGLFALASYSIQSRMKEIAIRKTLGAETERLLATLSKQYIFFCVLGFLIAVVPVYFLLDQWLANFAYRITISVLPFIIGFFALMLLTLAVVLSRAYQATRVNVLDYLKYE